MAFNPTPNQLDAINTKGNILVSAAAGSGKTAVLVERVIKKICSETEPVSADSLLIVTFTNAAAAEMRARIQKRLDEEIRNNPDNVSLLLQKHLLNSAKICTVDSFCIDLVRENFEKLDISPDFKMSDANSLSIVNQSVAAEIVNKYLEQNNPIFNSLLDIIGSEFDDSNFISFIINLFDYSRQLPFPKNWFKALSGYYNNGVFNSSCPWWKYCFSVAKRKIDEALSAIENGLEIIGVNEKVYNGYHNHFITAKAALNDIKNIADTNDWDKLYNAINSFDLPSLPGLRGVKGIDESVVAKSIYNNICKKGIDELSKLFYADLTYINKQFKKLYEPLCLLSDILIEFDEKLFERYKSDNTFTFHNTEHMALSLLCNEENGEIIIREDANEIILRFSEVMVDEYQDTNSLQDLLFYILSDREKKLFVVGDVKQSIYGFRGGNPTNFLDKKNRYIPLENACDNDPQKIILGNNFRCRPEICDFINFFFRLFMSSYTGEIVYNQEECLFPLAEFPEFHKNSTEFYLLDSKNADISDEILEARQIAKLIKEIMNEGEVIKVDKDTLRKANFSDFTILLRSLKNKAPILAEELKKQGIPASFGVEDFCESLEIAIFLSLLSVIDNPQSDIELTTLLMSPIFSFSADEMAELRINKRKGTLYSAVILSANSGNKKSRLFLDTIEKYRRYSVTMTLQKLILTLLNDTGYIDTVSAMNDGARRRNNLLLLCSYANQYETMGNSSVGGFVKYILKQSSIKAAAAPVSGDSVKIMSIHGSKGLQFPVCIVAGIMSNFNDSESRSSVLYTTDFGIGFKYFDEEEKTKLTTVSREAILSKIRADRLEEELRLLYVAMTRTQDRLIFVGSVSDCDKKLEKIKSSVLSSASTIDSSLFSQTKSYGDWLLTALMLHPDGNILRGNGHSVLVKDTESHISVNIINGENIKDFSSMDESSSSEVNMELANEVADSINYQYPYKELLSVESKASVSALANSAEGLKYAFSYRPAFMQSGGITPTERGTAMHKVMQFFDFSQYNCIEKELERLYEWQYISEREYNAINIKALSDFFNSNAFERIKNALRVEREMRFLTEIPVKEIAGKLSRDYPDERVIVQGAVDICFVEDDGIVILDFKTDRVDSCETLKECYGEQLNIYAMACEKIFDMPVKQKIIYSFALAKEIEV